MKLTLVILMLSTLVLHAQQDFLVGGRDELHAIVLSADIELQPQKEATLTLGDPRMRIEPSHRVVFDEAADENTLVCWKSTCRRLEELFANTAFWASDFRTIAPASAHIVGAEGDGPAPLHSVISGTVTAQPGTINGFKVTVP